MDDKRRKRLHWLLAQVLEGKSDVLTADRSKRFLEALCAEDDHSACISWILSSSHGVPAVQQAVRIDVTATTFNTVIHTFLQYLRKPELAAACGGDLLRQIVRHLVHPPLFWHELIRHVEAGRLAPETLDDFAWMLLQLLSGPSQDVTSFLSVATQASVVTALLDAKLVETRNLHQKIMHVVKALTKSDVADVDGPGGRHDNDFSDFRKIALIPTSDELFSVEPPYIRLASEIDALDDDKKLATHLDNQFRLLREDMLKDLREELQAKSKRRAVRIDGLKLTSILCDQKNRWALVFDCNYGLTFLPKGDNGKRLQFLRAHKNILAHGSIVCMMVDGILVGLGEIWRKENELAADTPQLHVQLPENDVSVRRTLTGLKNCLQIQVIQLRTALFAYEPVLKQLQNTLLLPLADRILTWKEGQPISKVTGSALNAVVDKLRNHDAVELQSMLSLKCSTRLDASQAQSLIVGLTQELAIIQGPPGTGKSFIGALVAKALWSLSSCRILVLSYTNHALDQYLEDLLDVGIAQNDVVRLGSSAKSSNRTKALVVFEQLRTSSDYKMTRTDWGLVDSYRAAAASAANSLSSSFQEFNQSSAKKDELLEYLEFSNDYLPYFDAFQIPEEQNGFQTIGEDGKAVNKYYLLDRWAHGHDPGVLKVCTTTHDKVWQATKEERGQIMRKWLGDVLEERLRLVTESGTQYNTAISQLDTVFSESNRRLMRDKRIIGCTTTAAAKYVKDIQSAAPDVIIVEEAGEILESHILTALGPQTKRLILIGDHKQLRPKAHYALSVEKGTDYDLNRSLFERLVLKGYPHQTLSQQHRMRPEISALVRALTYPDLTDAPSTQNRSALRGFQNNVIFVNHDVAENEVDEVIDPRDGGTPSKKNDHEAAMTLKCVKYLAQQGYGSDRIVVLTPYLGQLRLLYDVLATENDPVLNDLDSYDLVRAGIMPQATAEMNRQRLRISSIDNYQGEESDVVVVSLARSNQRGDIGFLSSPERLNVLISRARDGLIMIGNASTFLEARKGKKLWSQFLGLLKRGSHIYDGFPVKCERHPHKQALLSKPDAFDVHCQDGGCDAPCKALLNCGKHTCPQRCHQLYDHSKMACPAIIAEKCNVGHTMSWKCADNRPAVCKACEAKMKREAIRLQEEHDRRDAQVLAQLEHEDKIADVDRQIEAERQKIQQLRIAKDRDRAYEQKVQDLKRAKDFAYQDTSSKSSQPDPVKSSTLPQSSTTPTPSTPSKKTATSTPARSAPQLRQSSRPSAATKEWNQMQALEGVSNKALDDLMLMTGLEAVKTQFLGILQKLHTASRQGIDLKQERLGTVMLGNPGTCKTTVARLYARFLAELGVIAGTDFVETTGAKLANDGVNGTRKMVEDLMQKQGGCVFIDESYELVSGNNNGGQAVLDYLLAEIENTTGKLVFVFAGYDSHMEKFFRHNPGLPSRLPQQMRFADYSEPELLHMLQRKIEKKYNDRMVVEDGLDGLFMRIVVRRLHRESGREGFGNARALENVLSRLATSQSVRLIRERRSGKKPDDFMMTKDDLIGPEPSNALATCSAWKDLQKMVGLDAVKFSIHTLLDRLQENYRRELKELAPIQVSLNRLFLGSPGTGKTTVAKLYGRILADIGLLSTSECILKTPADFIGSVIGESEQKTKAILEATKGKVLVIDESYMLCSSLGSGSGSADPYRTAVVDTIVSEVQSTPGEDRAVLLLGYQEQMEEMLRKVNPGLARRFPLSNAFMFEDYSDNALRSILDHKLSQQDVSATDAAKDTAIDVLSKLRRRPNFGNAGEVENLLSEAKDRFSKRQQALSQGERADEMIFEPQDFDPDYDRGKNVLETIRGLFSDVVGSEEVITKLEGYGQSFTNAKSMGLDPEELVPFNFVFKGPPGTGKTTTARKMGTVFRQMGFLGSDDVVDCSATDLIGEFVGQTGPKVKRKLDEALGKTVVIDEAYRLGEGPFAKEAIDELVDCLTKTRYKGKMIVILAGYEAEINRLLSTNPGLSSRFSEELMFANLEPSMCVQLVKNNIRKKLQKIRDLRLDLSYESTYVTEIMEMFEALSRLSGWGNGRDVETVATRVANNLFKTTHTAGSTICIAWPGVLKVLQQLHTERKARAGANDIPTTLSNPQLQMQRMSKHTPSPASISTRTTIETSLESPKPRPDEEQDANVATDCQRDNGVSDAVWQQLQADKAAQAQAEAQQTADIKTEQTKAKESFHAAEQILVKVIELEEKSKEDDEARRRLEELRIQRAFEKRAADAHAASLRKLEAERQREAKAQQKLREMGVCCAGYRWIKQTGGYRCAGGAHWVNEESLGL